MTLNGTFVLVRLNVLLTCFEKTMNKMNIINTNPTLTIKKIAQVGKLLFAEESLLKSRRKKITFETCLSLKLNLYDHYNHI